MIVGLGIDVCDVARLGRALAGGAGERFRARVFTPAECEYCEARGPHRLESYAARFAAKEAVAKALGTGIGAALAWRDVEVVADGDSAPTLRLARRAAETAAGRGVTRWHLSLTHTAGVAAAVAVAEGDVSR